MPLIRKCCANWPRRSGEVGCRTRRKCSGCGQPKAGSPGKNAFTREEPFDADFAFPDLDDERVRTRLGEDGPRIVLADPVTGPFGSDVRTFSLPAHLFRGKLPGKEEINAARAELVPTGGLVLQVGGHRLTYDRTGLGQAKP